MINQIIDLKKYEQVFEIFLLYIIMLNDDAQW